ncbi:GH25 family lysozyme [Humibacter soli]
MTLAFACCSAAALGFAPTAAMATTAHTDSTPPAVSSTDGATSAPTDTPPATVAPTPTPTPTSSPTSTPSATATATPDETTPTLAEMNATHNHTMGSTIPRDSAAAPKANARLFAAAAAPAGVQGLDVSGWQSLTRANWTTIWNNGARFAYIKATESTDYTSGEFSEQYNDSYAAGLIRGAYHFATPNTSSGNAQANYFVAHGGGWSADGKTLPPLLDIEYNPYGATCYGLSQAQMVSWITDFSNTVQALTGRLPAIYSTTDWWTQCTGNSANFSKNPLFIARYTSNLAGGPGTLPASWFQYTFWQYADSGTFPGDQDVFNGSLLNLQTFAKTNPVKTTQPAVAPAIGRNVATAETTAGKVYVFWKGNNGDLWMKTKSGSTWSKSTDTGKWIGPGTGLSAAVNASGEFIVGWRGGDSGVWVTTSTNGSTWTAIVKVTAPGVAATTAGPTFDIAKNGTAYVFWKGQNNGLYQSIRTNGKWSNYYSIPADVGPGAALSSGIDGAGWTYVFWRGGDNNLWEANWTGKAWTTQHRIMTTGASGGVNSEVGVAVTAGAVQYVFWRGNDSRLYQTFWDGKAWRGYYQLPANVGPGTAVSASLDAKNATSVYWQGGDNGIWGAYWTGTAWTGAQAVPAG